MLCLKTMAPNICLHTKVLELLISQPITLQRGLGEETKKLICICWWIWLLFSYSSSVNFRSEIPRFCFILSVLRLLIITVASCSTIHRREIWARVLPWAFTISFNASFSMTWLLPDILSTAPRGPCKIICSSSVAKRNASPIDWLKERWHRKSVWS